MTTCMFFSAQEQGVVGISRPPGAIPPPHPAGGVASGVGPNQGSGPPPGYVGNQQQAAMMKQMMAMEQEKRVQMHMMEQQQKQQQLFREQRQQQQQLLAEQVRSASVSLLGALQVCVVPTAGRPLICLSCVQL